jgi:uncharacterized protein
MSADANRKLMEEIFDAAANPDPAMRDRSLFVASLADDVKWVVTGQYSWSRTFTGLRYDNEYCLVFRLADGKIREVREYCDSVLTEKALGRFPEPHQADKSATA